MRYRNLRFTCDLFYSVHINRAGNKTLYMNMLDREHQRCHHLRDFKSSES